MLWRLSPRHGRSRIFFCALAAFPRRRAARIFSPSSARRAAASVASASRCSFSRVRSAARALATAVRAADVAALTGRQILQRGAIAVLAGANVQSAIATSLLP